MKTFQNKNFTKRNYECTNVVACQGDVSPNDNFIEADESVLNGLTKLYVENGIAFYGYM